jgi:hypothetical protein
LTAELLLEYLKVILSWPVMGALLGLAVVRTFRPQIASILERPLKLKWPGGGATFGSQERTARAELPASTTPPAVPSSESGVTLPDGLQEASETGRDVVQLVQSERAHAALWEYRYLNLYLVRGTQMVLDWLATLPQGISTAFYDSQLQAHIADANERIAILNALQRHHLLTLQNGLLRVTDKGREYLRWRGPLPSSPQSGNAS